MQPRRQFLKISAGAAALGFIKVQTSCAETSNATRHVWVLSDLHSGRVDDGKDGAEWFRLACEEMKTAFPDIACAMTLGDISHDGNEEQMVNYINARNNSGIKTWYELAGNHEYHKGKAEAFQKLIRSTDPYSITDGNIAWFFLSDQKAGVPGELMPEACDWLERELTAHKDKNIIVCSHQLVSGTTFRSGNSQRVLHPVDHLAEIIAKSKIDLWLHGHEHHTPYQKQHIARVGDTTFINVASMSHAYGTGRSESYVLELKPGATEIIARRRHHDIREFNPEFETRIPLRHPIQ